VKLTVAGAPYTLTGGTCDVSSGQFTLNLGVVAGPDLAGPKPDYVGLTTSTASGAFSNAVLAVDVDGKGYAVMQNSGSAAMTGGAFTGKAPGGEQIDGTFTC
jgi:hypothetical protein